MSLNIPVLLGTTRENNGSKRVAKFVAEIANSIEGITSQIVDPAELNLPGDGNDESAKDPVYSKITADADAFIIVTPEYNHSFPGSLKRMLDSELKNYIHKPVGFCGVSSGRFGGTRAIEALVPVTRELGMVPTFGEVFFGNVWTLFDDNGQITEPEKYTEFVTNLLTEVTWMAKSLKWGRENLESGHHK